MSRFVTVLACLAAISSSAQLRASDEVPVNPQLDQYLAETLRAQNIPAAAVAVVHGEEVEFLRGFGRTGSRQQINANTPFFVSGLSESLATFAAIHLANEGSLDLSRSVSTYIDQRLHANVQDKIQLQHLLMHSSGYSTIAGRSHYLHPPSAPDALREYVGNLQHLPSKYAPGTRYEYSNVNNLLLARVIEVVTNRPIEDYLRTVFFDPNGMHSTEWSRADFGENKPVEGHRFWFGIPVAGGDLPKAQNFVTGLYTTVSDMARYLKLLMRHSKTPEDGREREINLMGSPTDVGHESPKTLGWFVHTTQDGQVVEHQGQSTNFSFVMLMDPVADRGVVVLYNAYSLAKAQQMFGIAKNVLAISQGRAAKPLGNGTVLQLILLLPIVLLITQIHASYLLVKSKRQRKSGQPPIRTWVYLTLSSALALVTLIVVPEAFQMPHPLIFWFVPDFAWPLAVGLAVAAIGVMTTAVLSGSARTKPSED